MTVPNKIAQADQAVQNAQHRLQEAMIKKVQTDIATAKPEELAKKADELAAQSNRLFIRPSQEKAVKAREFSKTSSPTDAKKEETASSGIITTITGYVASTLGGVWGWLGSSAGSKS